MTHKQIDRYIANLIEPMPTDPPKGNASSSPAGQWYSGMGDTGEVLWKWQPTRKPSTMIGDTMRALTWLQEHNVIRGVTMSWDIPRKLWYCLLNHDDNSVSKDEELTVAICQAIMKVA